MKASDAMVPDPHVAVAGAMASEVAIMLKTRNISVVPVVDDHRTRRFLGTLSDRDLAFHRADMSYGAEPGAFKLFIGTSSDAVSEADFALTE